MRAMIRQAFGYGAASVCALAVDMAILGMLVHYFSWGYLAAASVSFSAGMVVAYLISIRFVFEHRRLDDASAEFVGFAALGAIGLCVNALVMYLAVRLAGLHYLLAKCVAAGFTFACNFATRRQLLFVRRPGTQ
jgi:putative flippase GtrA